MPINVDHQLDNARLLAMQDKRRPRETSLRRAVWTAYYALFNALCQACADELVGWSKPWQVYTPIFRAVDHSGAAQALDPRHWRDTPELQQLGRAFGDLRAAREWADYNPEPRPNFDAAMNGDPFTRDEALRLIEAAELALRILLGLNPETRLRLIVRLVAKTRR